MDELDFTPTIERLADILHSPDTSTPLTIGILGTYGIAQNIADAHSAAAFAEKDVR